MCRISADRSPRKIRFGSVEHQLFVAMLALKNIGQLQGKPPEQTFRSYILRSKTGSRTKFHVYSDFRQQKNSTSKDEWFFQPTIAFFGSWDDCKAKPFVLGNRKSFPWFLWFYGLSSINESCLWPKYWRRKVFKESATVQCFFDQVACHLLKPPLIDRK